MDALQSAPWLYALARVFEGAGAPLYLVGGAVRNPLMDLPLSDIDACGPLRPEAVVALCENTPVRAFLRAAHFGTVELHVVDEQGARHMAEYTTFREDSYRCGHRPDAVRFTTDIRVDARRRDFSVNALYRQLTTDGLLPVIDPTGGLEHLKNGVLHTVTDDPDRVLGDDGLRILRAARFQAELALQPTDALLESQRRHAELLREIAPERLRDEWQKTLLADVRYPTLKRRASGAASGLRTVEGCGAWQYVMGDIAWDERAVAAIGALCEAQVDETVSPFCLRMALLCRNAGVEKTLACMERLRYSRKDAKQTASVVGLIGLFEKNTLAGGSELAAPTLIACASAGRAAMQAALAALEALADVAAVERCAKVWDALRGKPWEIAELAVNGDDLKPLLLAKRMPMRRMGELLTSLWQSALAGDVENEKAALLVRAAEWADGVQGMV